MSSFFPQHELRVPLHQVHEQGLVLDRLDYSVRRPGGNDQILAGDIDGLMMAAVDHDLGTEQFKQPGAGFDCHRMIHAIMKAYPACVSKPVLKTGKGCPEKESRPGPH